MSTKKCSGHHRTLDELFKCEDCSPLFDGTKETTQHYAMITVWYSIKMLLVIAGIILAADLLGFVIWILSGQTPIDSFYWGGITGELLSIIL
jgi:hypothetical protein